MENNNQRFIISFIVMIFIMSGAFAIYYFNVGVEEPLFVQKENDEMDKENPTADFEAVVNLNIDELETKYASGEKFVIIIIQTGCGYCEQFIPTYNQALTDLGISGYAINLTNLGSEAEHARFYSMFEIDETPTTIVVNNNEIIKSLTGGIGLEELKIWLRAYLSE